MTWTPLESKMLASAAYEADRQILYLRFRDAGDVYRYFDFAADNWHAFLEAESKGRFFLAHIRNHHRYERMAKLRAA